MIDERNYTRPSEPDDDDPSWGYDPNEGHFFDGFTSAIVLLVNALLWAVIAVILIYFNAMIPAFICLGIGTVCVLIWVVFNAIPWVLKWLVSLVEI